MKKIICFILFIIFSNNLFGLDFWDFFEDFGMELVPIRYDISKNKDLNHEFSLSLINIYFESPKTGLGFDTRFILPKYSYNLEHHEISFFGIGIYWNVLRLMDIKNKFIKESIFGPCFSIDYLNWNVSEAFSTIIILIK